MGRKLKVGFVVLLMVLSLVPAYAVTAGSSGNGSDSTGYMAANQTNRSTNATKAAAEVMLRNLERLQNYTTALLNETENVSAEVMELYERALNLTDEAKSLYSEGKYWESLHTSILAMKAYKDVIRGIRLGTEPEFVVEMRRAGVEAKRIQEYLKHVGILIRVAEMKGLNVSSVSELYNQTRLAYMKVLQDIRINNTTALSVDLEKARELRMKLDMELRNIQIQFAIRKADKIARAFDIRLEIMTRTLERIKRVPGVNETTIENITQELNQLRAKVDQLISEGKYFEALQLIKKATPKLVIGAIHLRWIQKDKTIYWPLGRPHCHPSREMGHWGHRP